MASDSIIDDNWMPKTKTPASGGDEFARPRQLIQPGQGIGPRGFEQATPGSRMTIGSGPEKPEDRDPHRLL